MTARQQQPALYLTVPHACAYFPERRATMLFADPRHPAQDSVYEALINIGFRRSGDFVYRPHCQHCTACVPVRIPVHAFKPSRGQRRVWRKNQDLTVKPCEPVFRSDHFELYQRYQAARHPGGGMDDPDPEKYIDFLTSAHTRSCFYEMHLDGKLLCVAVVDRFTDAFSAVYTFYDPEQSRRGLGVYAILWEIAEAKRLGLAWLYLGFWIKDCQKMDYKADYRPLEVYRDQRWILLEQ